MCVDISRPTVALQCCRHHFCLGTISVRLTWRGRDARGNGTGTREGRAGAIGFSFKTTQPKNVQSLPTNIPLWSGRKTFGGSLVCDLNG